MAMAESTSCCEKALPQKLADTILAFTELWESWPKYCVTSAAAERAAFMTAPLAEGTGFHRFSFTLQYVSDRFGGPAG